MNGVVVEAMEQRGLKYRRNFGVDVPRLRSIAGDYPKSHDLAQRLWQQDIRETMLLATLLQPAEQFTKELAIAWLDKCTNIELVEQMNMQLYRHLDYAPQLALECLSHTQPLRHMFGYTLALRVYEKLSHSELLAIANKALEEATTDDLLLAQSIAGCLARFCRKDNTTAQAILAAVQSFSTSPQNSLQLIYQSVHHELIFLGLLEEDL